MIFNMEGNQERSYEINYGKREVLERFEEEVFPVIGREYKELRPDILKDFKGVYPPDELKSDYKRTLEAKRRHGERTERSAFLEAVVGKELIDFGLYGDEATASPTTDYDDFFNGTDIVVEFGVDERGENAPKLCIDVTTGADGINAREKRDRILESVGKGKLTDLKYFNSSAPEDNSYKGEVKMLPKVIVGTDSKGVKNIAKIMYGVVFGEDGKGKGQDSYLDGLERHYLQIEFLEETRDQLAMYIEEAKKAGFRDDQEIVYKQKEVLDIIEEILQEKMRSISLPDEARNNPVYTALTAL